MRRHGMENPKHLTRCDLARYYEDATYCIRGHVNEDNIPEDIVKLGYNSGKYGWNWSLYIGLDSNTLYIESYRNVPSYIIEK